MITGLGLLIQLGSSGVGKYIHLVGQFNSLIPLLSSNGVGVVGIGVGCARCIFVRIHSSWDLFGSPVFSLASSQKGSCGEADATPNRPLAIFAPVRSLSAKFMNGRPSDYLTWV